jgi:cbb3-type cytochrome oxidase subunit 1
VRFAAITLGVTSQRVFIAHVLYFVINSVRKKKFDIFSYNLMCQIFYSIRIFKLWGGGGRFVSFRDKCGMNLQI